jgi:hypothetical protein
MTAQDGHSCAEAPRPNASFILSLKSSAVADSGTRILRLTVDHISLGRDILPAKEGPLRRPFDGAPWG